MIKSLIENAEFRNEFVIELKEFVQEFEDALESIKKQTNIDDNINILIRIHHTLKGDIGIFELDNFVKFFRALELFLRKFSDPQKFIKIFNTLFPILTESLNLIRELLNQVIKKDISDLDLRFVNKIETDLEKILL